MSKTAQARGHGIDLDRQVFHARERVLLFVIFNHPNYMELEELLPGVVDHVFEAAGQRIYRIELDMCWSREFNPHENGRQIVMGNVYARQLSRPLT